MVNERVGTSDWNDGAELGDTWQSRNSFSYGRSVSKMAFFQYPFFSGERYFRVHERRGNQPSNGPKSVLRVLYIPMLPALPPQINLAFGLS